MRALMISIVALAALTGAAQAASDQNQNQNQWSPQISGLRLSTPLAPDNSLNVPAGYAAGVGSAGGAWQFGGNSNFPALSSPIYALFQKGAFPFRR